MKRLIVGCGYLGRRVADLWHRAGDVVYVVTRNQSHGTEFQRLGLFPLLADVLAPQSLADLPEVDTVLFAVGYDRSTQASIHQVYVEGLHNLLDALPEQAGQVLYISSTGVYAESGGGWVDEHSPTRASREGTRACLDAENILQSHPRGIGYKILRLAGIYGPNRIPRRDDLLAGRPLPVPAEGYLNLIHVEDATKVVDAAARRGESGIYPISDGAPTIRQDYLEELARLLGAPPPKFLSDVKSVSARGATSKRVKNDRMLRELGVQLIYPSYREGLAAIVDGTSV